jgi:transposase
LLSCLMSAGDVAAGARCCRLASSHRPVSRVRRYPTDVTDAQWAVLDSLLPDPAWLAGRGGRREKHCRRMIVDAILYVVDNGIKWRALPADFPPWPTVYKRFSAWEKTGTTQRLLDGLRDRARLSAGRTTAPSAAIIDSQSVRAAETVSRATRGYDAGKKVQGRKRHIVVDTAGFLLAVLVTPASTPDRVAARYLLRRLCYTVGNRLRLVWADGGYTGTLLTWARTTLGLIVEIVQRPDLPRFTVLPHRWVVERTLAWITRHRRCVRDYERLRHHHEAIVRWAMIRITSRRLT